MSHNFFWEKGLINFFVETCHKTCSSCSYYGNYINHFCETCSEEYPYYSNISNLTTNSVNNCVKVYPENYTNNGNNICISLLIMENTYIITQIKKYILKLSL